jgi:hypothetical protein
MYLRNVRRFEPLVSPARAKLHGLPPIHVQTRHHVWTCRTSRYAD